MSEVVKFGSAIVCLSLVVFVCSYLVLAGCVIIYQITKRGKR